FPAIQRPCPEEFIFQRIMARPGKQLKMDFAKRYSSHRLNKLANISSSVIPTEYSALLTRAKPGKKFIQESPVTILNITQRQTMIHLQISEAFIEFLFRVKRCMLWRGVRGVESRTGT